MTFLYHMSVVVMSYFSHVLASSGNPIPWRVVKEREREREGFGESKWRHDDTHMRRQQYQSSERDWCMLTRVKWEDMKNCSSSFFFAFFYCSSRFFCVVLSSIGVCKNVFHLFFPAFSFHSVLNSHCVCFNGSEKVFHSAVLCRNDDILLGSLACVAHKTISSLREKRGARGKENSILNLKSTLIRWFNRKLSRKKTHIAAQREWKIKKSLSINVRRQRKQNLSQKAKQVTWKIGKFCRM